MREPIIRVSCDWCGTVETTTSHVELDLTGPAYRFDCPHCESRFRKPATNRMVAILTSLGCRIVDEPGPITIAEIEAFATELQDW